jgi:hypothetical protein
MLPAARIREFLRHPDADIRLAAARSFDDAHDCGDATMADWWAAADALGIEVAQPLLHHLDDLPETEATFTRLLEELRKGLAAKVWHSLMPRLRAAPFPMLERRIGELREMRHLIAPADLRHLEERLALASVEPAVLWERLMAHAADCEGEYAGGQDAMLVERLVEALARHPDFATPRALEILRDASIEDWREIFAVELAGELRCREAIDPLIGKLRIDADYLLERARAALVRIGDATIPARIAADWGNETWNFKNFAHGAIASFRTEENAALLRELIAREEDDDMQGYMAVSLLEMLPDDATTLAAAREFILTMPGGPGFEELDALLATVATMAGWDFPERAEWRAKAIASEERLRRFFEDDSATDEAMRAQMIAGAAFEEASRAVFGSRPPLDWAGGLDDEWDDAPSLPFVREKPKIGRNDPCPCNSGKKYKRCCGKAA